MKKETKIYLTEEDIKEAIAKHTNHGIENISELKKRKDGGMIVIIKEEIYNSNPN